MELYLIRHGETEANEKRLFQGWLDFSLNQSGRDQVFSLRNSLEGKIFLKIFSSPLKRASETAEIISTGLIQSPEIELVDELKECNFGIWEGLRSEEIQEKYPDVYQSWLDNWQDTVIPEGESAIKMFERVNSWLDPVIKNHLTDDKIMIVTHEGVILQIITYLLGFELSQCWRFRVLPGSLSIIKILSGFAVLSKLNHTID